MTIEWGQVIVNTEEGFQHLPDTETPYYVAAEEGLFLHTRTLQGRSVTRAPYEKARQKIKKVGNQKGLHLFDGARVPAAICAQAIDFFTRIWRTHHTEAELIITQHWETKAFRLFVPTQRVSGGGVHSIYDPTTIQRGWLVVGTFHSHPGSAYHSSTDEADASEMDGIHFTVGYLDRDAPEVDAMVAVNGLMFGYKPEDLGDFSDLTAATAPAWWDRYLRFDMPTDADRPAWVDDENWKRYLGHLPQQHKGKTTTYVYPDQRQRPSWDDWDDDWAGWRQTMKLIPPPKRAPDDDYWEDQLGKEYVDALLATNLLFTTDMDDAVDNSPDSGTPEYWETLIQGKMHRAIAWLRKHGYHIDLRILATKPKP